MAVLPTPVQPLDVAPDLLGPGDLWVKRDDLVSPLYGGNKVRRFEYILAAAREAGARRLVTVGGLASTQVTATILFGRASGFDVTTVLFDQPKTEFLRRQLLTDLGGGGDLRWGGGYGLTALRTLLALRALERPYLVVPGAAGPRENLGYVDAALELAAQVEAGEAPRPDLIVTPSGSGGTLAALAVGMSLLGWPTRVIGIRITDRIACNRVTVGQLCRLTARFLERRAGPSAKTAAKPRFEIDHRFAGRGYGHPTPEAIEAMGVVPRFTGTPGEVTYSGKGLAGLRRIAAENPGKVILYWHTLSSAPVHALGAPDALPPPLLRAYRAPTSA